jgi:hypothetical protein
MSPRQISSTANPSDISRRWIAAAIVRYLLPASILLAGMVDARGGRRSYAADDSVSYMTMASQLSQGHLSHVMNGLWSPLYPILLTPFVSAAGADAAREFAMVRIVNFAIFVVTAGIFGCLLGSLLNHLRGRRLEAPPVRRTALEVTAWSLFAVAGFSLNFVCRVSPDMCVMAIFFAAAERLLSLHSGRLSRANFMLFGAILGLGYWAKAIMLPFACLFLAAAFLHPIVRTVKQRMLWSVLAMCLVACPLVIGLSSKYGRLSFGESSRLNYAWHVNHVPYPCMRHSKPG